MVDARPALLEGELALIQGEFETEVQQMSPALQCVYDIRGGSQEQRDIFQDIYLSLNRQLSNVDDVLPLAQTRLQRNPHHFQSMAALAWVYQATGRPTIQRQICEERLQRAETLPTVDDVQALHEAQQVLSSQ